MRRRLAPTLAALLLGFIALAGCSSGTSTPPAESGDQQATSEVEPAAELRLDSLEGTWALTGATSDGAVLEDLPEATLTVEPGGAFAIDASCNSMSGVFSVEGEGLQSSPLTSTLMACPENIADFEAVAAKVMSEMSSSTLTQGGELTLEGDGDVLVFQKQE